MKEKGKREGVKRTYEELYNRIKKKKGKEKEKERKKGKYI